MRVPGPGIWSLYSNILVNPALYFHSLMQEYGDVIRCNPLLLTGMDGFGVKIF